LRVLHSLFTLCCAILGAAIGNSISHCRWSGWEALHRQITRTATSNVIAIQNATLGNLTNVSDIGSRMAL